MIDKKLKNLANLLYEDSSQYKVDLAKKMNLSRQTITKYIKNLREILIKRFATIDLNPDLRIFFIEIKTNPEEPEIIKKLNLIESVQSIDGVIGDTSLIVKFKVENNSEFTNILNKIDNIVTSSRFQYYRIIECLAVFKSAGYIYNENEQRSINTILIKTKYIKNTDFQFKFYLKIMPKNLSEYKLIAEKYLAPKENIIELYRTGQEYGLLAVVRTNDIKEYREFIELLYKTRKIQDTITIMVIDERLPTTFKPFRVKLN